MVEVMFRSCSSHVQSCSVMFKDTHSFGTNGHMGGVYFYRKPQTTNRGFGFHTIQFSWDMGGPKVPSLGFVLPWDLNCTVDSCAFR